MGLGEFKPFPAMCKGRGGSNEGCEDRHDVRVDTGSGILFFYFTRDLKTEQICLPTKMLLLARFVSDISLSKALHLGL